MEVHHHPHPEKKKFKEYFLEFLMIFLAVTMGFFAENIREYFSDNERVSQLSEQLVQDVKKDTANLNLNITQQTKLQKQADTLFKMLQQPLAIVDKKILQRRINICFESTLFTPSTGAITAIKSVLNLKQFAHSETSSLITDYETQLYRVKNIEAIQIQQVQQVIEVFMKEHFSPANLYAIEIGNSDIDESFRKLTQDDMTQLSASIVRLEQFNLVLINVYNTIKVRALALMQYMRKEYKPEEK